MMPTVAHGLHMTNMWSTLDIILKYEKSVTYKPKCNLFYKAFITVHLTEDSPLSKTMFESPPCRLRYFNSGALAVMMTKLLVFKQYID